jgi:hypothetical protein
MAWAASDELNKKILIFRAARRNSFPDLGGLFDRAA